MKIADTGRAYPVMSSPGGYGGVGGAAVSQWKEPVRVATTAAITLATGLENGDTIDGVTLATGDRVLVKDQASGLENGIYIVNASGAPDRALDYDHGREVWGSLVYVIAGTANGGKVYRNTNTTLPTIDTDALTFAELAAAASLTYATTSDIADVAATESAGAATTVPRGDHVHRLGITTTRGDLIRRGASDNERFALGSAGQILTAGASDPAWGNGPLTTRGDIITAGASGAIQRLALGADGRRLGSDGTDAVWLEDFRIIQAWLDGGGVTLTTGLKLWTSPLPWDAVPVAWYLDGDADGAAVVDIGKGTTWAGSALSSMCASDKPTITATGGTDLTATGSCTGWSTITAGDRLSVNLDSVTSFKKLMVGIKVRLTS